MQSKLILLLFLVFATLCGFSQLQDDDYQLAGFVVNDRNEPMAGAHIFLAEKSKQTLSDSSGYFYFTGLKRGQYSLHVSFIGYRCIHPYRIFVDQKNTKVTVIMEPENLGLEEVVIFSDQREEANRTPQAVVGAGEKYLRENRGSSLMTSLEKLPGVQAMTIGQGLSKPMIRGLSFNRVVVTENNIKVEGQQWGADHGLEVDQFGVEQIEIIKGPSSLIYGSDALGGVVRIMPHALASPGSIETEVNTILRSVNDLLGISVRSRYRAERFFTYVRFTQTRFSDYRVPADSFYYNRYRFEIPNRRLKNTAGVEQSAYFTAGWMDHWGKLSISASNVFAKTGFFPGAHGLPSAAKLRDDGSLRNIELPFQQVNHFKFSFNGIFVLDESRKLIINGGYQSNHRQEWSLFHSHFPGQQAPEINPDLELEWVLDTWLGDIVYRRQVSDHRLDFGLSTAYQANRIDGYMFLIPSYQKTGVGAFYVHDWKLNKKWRFNWGLRYDWGNLKLDYYFSPFTSTVKSPNFNGDFNDLSWGAGVVFDPDNSLMIKLNLARSFRMPVAAELGSNGIHHGSFRYELGDTTITSEYAYQADLTLQWQKQKWYFAMSPFAAYFPNFIYLNPTGSYLMPDGTEIQEADAGQIYRYVQSEAYRFGAEMEFGMQLSRLFDWDIQTEYVYTTDGVYPIPFTPPFKLVIGINHKLPAYWRKLHQTQLRCELISVAKQELVARNELVTPGYNLFNISFSTKILTAYFPLGIDLQWQNVFNAKYFSHLSFYRQLQLPEAGTNIQLSLSVPINANVK